MNRHLTYDMPDEGPIPSRGDYLVSRHRKDGRWGSAYLILRARRIHRRGPADGRRRFDLEVQKQPSVTPEILRLAKFWLCWNAPKAAHKPELFR